MDSDAGMYTLTQCVGVPPPTQHYTQPIAGLPLNWSSGGGEELHYTTLENSGQEASTEHYEHLHTGQSHPDEAAYRCPGEDPYSYPQHIHPCQDIRGTGYTFSARDEEYGVDEGKLKCYGKNNNNSFECDKEQEKAAKPKTLKSRKSSPGQGTPNTRSKAGRGKVVNQNHSPGKSSGGDTTISGQKKQTESGEDDDQSEAGDVSNYDNVMVWLNHQACGGTVKRKRRITKTQRVAANQRERKRMVHLNTAFECLRETIPSFPYEKKLSRIQTLKLAIDYIAFMTEILYGKNAPVSSSLSGYTPFSGSDSSNFNGDLHYW